LIIEEREARVDHENNNNVEKVDPDLFKYRGRGRSPKHKARGNTSTRGRNAAAFHIAQGFVGSHKTTRVQNLETLEEKVSARRAATNNTQIDKELAPIIPDIGFSRSRTTRYSLTLDLY
jgi:hypothetical protein